MTCLQTTLSLDDFIDRIAAIPAAQLRLEDLQDCLKRLSLSDRLLAPKISFCSQRYRRKLLCRTARFDLLLLCWQPGQSSTIHDHLDSLNVTRVYRGSLTARLFTRCWGDITLEQEEQLASNELASVDRYQIHQLANTSEENLVTLHVYAHPLSQIQVYSPQSDRVERLTIQYDQL